MTVTTSLMRSGPYTADGVNEEFSFTFKIKDADHLAVVVADDAIGTNSVRYTSGYTIDDQWLDRDAGGIVTFQIGGIPVVAGKRVWVLGNVPYEQGVEFRRQGPYNPLQVMDALDSLAIQGKQTAELLGRAVVSDPGGDIITAAEMIELRDDAAASEYNASLSASASAASALSSAASAVLSGQFKDMAVAAGEAIGSILFFDTYALANAAVGSIANLGIAEVFVDETRGSQRTRYRKEGGVLVFKVLMTENPFITPEMYGARADGVTNDLTAIANAITAARALGVPMFGRGFYATNGPIDIAKPGGVEYWDGSTTQRPIKIYIDRLKTSSVDAAVKFNGSLVSDQVEIGHMIGPGTGAVGTPGAGAERIGVLLTGPVDFKLGSWTDFNFGVVLQGCFSFDIDLGFGLACLKGLYARVTPGDSNGTNQSGNLRLRKAGGAFTSEAFGNDALRRARSCDVGVQLDSMHGAEIDLGSPEYCQLNSTSVAVVIGAAVTKNEIRCYLEGARDDGEFFQCAGSDNQIHFSGLGSVSNIKIGAIRVTGLGNDIYGLGDTLGASSKAGFAPQGSFGLVQIKPGNTVHGKYKQKVHKAPSILRLNLLTDATAFTATSGLTVTTSTSDVPAGHDFKESYEMSMADNSVRWYTSGNITVTGETRDIVRVKTAVRGITNHPKVAFYLLTGGGTLLSADHSITADPLDADWSVIEYLARIGTGITNMLFRFSVRNVSPGETGGVLRVCRPLLSYNLTGPLVRSNTVMPHENGVVGDYIAKSILAMQGIKYSEQLVTDIAATVFDVNSSGLAVCTAHPSGNSVNLINSLVEGQPTMIINKSGSSITFTVSAMDSGAVVLADGEGMTVVKRVGGSKATRVG